MTKQTDNGRELAAIRDRAQILKDADVVDQRSFSHCARDVNALLAIHDAAMGELQRKLDSSETLRNGNMELYRRSVEEVKALSAENAALRNLANNLQPGPISEAMAGTRYTREAELSAELEKARAVMEDCASDLEYKSADASDLPVVARKLRMYLSTSQPGNGREDPK